ncbi:MULTISPECIES: hypothetical protein [Burkholderia]|uniref:hypothetical protein n=1 Tax=Burkholderia TaxID=32008 RepID=UPI0001A4B24C|nr:MULTISPECIES: hypothetical protein [Burkholderia]ACR27319.1 Hypothetical protein bglu_1g01170 [Burkholderia glumae BGR1]MDZ4036176.1 hypothetical protein [Burkholderia gladioli pv. alliicola]PRH36726.1 hypothetical protein C6V07_07625 [Burkholderia gladioli]UVT00405.1 hypothetical protein EFP20_01180 [Burkholderia glumae]
MATALSAPVVTPFDVSSLSLQQRIDYLSTLCLADIELVAFVEIARKLGYTLTGRWDCENDRPVLKPALYH